MNLEYKKEEEVIAARLEKAHDPSTAKIRGEFFQAENLFFSQNIRDQRVMVAGSGLGHDAFELAKNNSEVVGVELLENLITASEDKLRKQGINNLRFVRGNIENLPFKDNSFDATVLNMGTIGNFNDKVRVLSELLRVAKKIYFDFYPATPSGLEKRKQMYEEEGWHNVRIENEALISDDGLYSKSIKTKEIEDLAEKLGAKIFFYQLNDYAIMAEMIK